MPGHPSILIKSRAACKAGYIPDPRHKDTAWRVIVRTRRHGTLVLWPVIAPTVGELKRKVGTLLDEYGASQSHDLLQSQIL